MHGSTHSIPAISGVDTRALTRRIRDLGAPNGVLCVNFKGEFDIPALRKQAAEWSGLDGLDLAKDVTCAKKYEWSETLWTLGSGYGAQKSPRYHVVAMDFGAKRNILRCLAASGCRVSVVPAMTSAEDILSLNPDGVFLSNGPGDPAATGVYAVPTIRALLEKNVPILEFVSGTRCLLLLSGARLPRWLWDIAGGSGWPVQDLKTGKVEITSQNHGFHVLPESLPKNVEVTHISLFDKTNEGLRATDKPAFSVQYHPEASPGPMDTHYLFDLFVEMIEESKKKKAA